MYLVKQFIENNLSLCLLSLAALFLVLFVWNIAIQAKLSRIKRKNEVFFAGGKVSNLEELLLEQSKNVKALDTDIQELYNISNQINNLAFRSYHKIGLIRFNPFKDVGGDQSFALAILNGKNNGVTISSLYTREGTRVYTKSIVSGKSDKHPLTEEEKQAIKIAIGSEKTKLEIEPEKNQ